MAKSQEGIDMNDIVICHGVEMAELDEVDRVWRSGQWNFGVPVLRFITDPELCECKMFLAKYRGDIIGTGIAYKVNEKVATLGGFLVKPEFRNLGIGQKIWDARMIYMGDRNVQVNAMSRRSFKNMRLGFTHYLTDINIYVGVPSYDPFNMDEFKGAVEKFVPIQECPFEDLVAYDFSIVKEINRRSYLRVLLQKYKIRGYVAYKDCVIVGYVGEIPADDFALISPLYGKSPRVAEALLKRFLLDLPKDTSVFLHPPQANEEAVKMVEGIGLHKSDYMKMLFNKHPYDVDWNPIYSVMSPVTMLW